MSVVTQEIQDQVSELYITFFGRAPDAVGFGHWAQSLANGATVSQIAQSFSQTPEFESQYGGLTPTQQVSRFYENVLNRAPDAGGLAYWVGQVNSGIPFYDVAYTIVNTAFEGGPGVGADDNALVVNKVTVAEYFALELASNDFAVAQTAFTTVTADPASVTATEARLYAEVNAGTTYTLTTNIEDVTANTFNGVINNNGVTNASTFQTGDILNGKGATGNVLNLTVADYVASPVVTMNNVNVVNVRNVDTGVTSTLNAATWSGVTEFWSNGSLADIGVTGLASAAAIGLRDTEFDSTVTFANSVYSSGGAVTLALSNAGDTGSTPAASLITVGQASGTGKANSLVIAATGDNFVEVNSGAAVVAGATGGIKTLTVVGTGSVEIEATSELSGTALSAQLTTVNASDNSGGVVLSLGNVKMAVTGGSGDDTIILVNTAALGDAASISLGAGDDELVATGAGGLGTKAVVDGGAGIDTIQATLLSAGNAKNILNFEILDIAGASGTIDSTLYTGSTFESLQLSAATAGAMTVTKLAGTDVVLNVTNSAALTQAAAITATLATTSGTSDTATINFAGEDDATLANFVTTGVETVTVVSGGDDGVINTATLLTLNDNSTTSIVISGAENFVLSGVSTNVAATNVITDTASALTLIDGSDATGNLNITAGAATAITGSGSTANMTYNSLTINGGEGDDTISIGGRGTVNTGDGEDVINVAALGVTVNVGADAVNDDVILGAGADFTGAFASSTRITTLINMDAADTISFVAPVGALATFTNYTTTAQTFGSLVDAVNGALASSNTGAVNFFTWADGNTYLVAEASGNTSATVVALEGTYAFADLSLAAGIVTFA